MKKLTRAGSGIILAGAIASLLMLNTSASAQTSNILVSRSSYQGTATQIVASSTTLPNGATATASDAYPNVWNNETPDASFGITSPILLDQMSVSGSTASLIGSINITTALASQSITMTTSFPSKSELALNVSTDGNYVTFMGYDASSGQLDVSNANTPGHLDSTNLVGSLTYQRMVGQVSLLDGSVTATAVNAYSGNNGRAAILANGNYYMVGNAGNSGNTVDNNTLSMLSDNTGVQMIAASSSGNTTVVGQVNGTYGSKNGYQRGFTIQGVLNNGVAQAADKTGKDDNFRGMTIFNNTLYATKGSGSNGMNTVFQVGTVGSLPTLANAGTTSISILPGFPTVGDKTTGGGTEFYPFGIWFANATTLYVGDEGKSISSSLIASGGLSQASNDQYAGLEKWIFDGSKWNLAYTLQTGLNLGVGYTVSGSVTDGGAGSVSVAPAGLRNISGQVNGDGTVTIYGITSTVSTETDQGADPNQLVSITDTLSDTTAAQASGESFNTLETASYGDVLRGVTVVPEPQTYALLLSGVGALSLWMRRRSRK